MTFFHLFRKNPLGRHRDYGPPPPHFGGPHGPYDHGGPPPRRGGGEPRGGGGGRRGRDEGPPGVSLLVRNVAPDITTHDLQSSFGRIGVVRDVYIPRDFHSQKPRGFAFIEYATPEMAREAKQEMNRFVIKGHALEVVFAQERRKTPNEMRGRGDSAERDQEDPRDGGPRDGGPRDGGPSRDGGPRDGGRRGGGFER